MSEPELSLRRRVLFRLALFLLLLLVTLALLEGLLQVASFFARPRSVDLAELDQEAVILCVGDSNTYGVFYPPDQAYPAQLQEVLERREPGRFKTVNLGLPGMNSSQIVTRLEGWLDRYRPQAVVVSAGINNYWNTADTFGEHRRSWLDRSRLVRLARLLAAGENSSAATANRPDLEWVSPDGGVSLNQQVDAATGEVLIEHLGNWREWNRSDVEVAAEVAADLEAMSELTRRRSVRLILMTYAAVNLPDRPSRFSRQERVNEAMRRFAVTSGTTLVDLAPRFSGLLGAESPRALLFASESDSHANPVGNREIAALVAAAILDREASEGIEQGLDTAVHLFIDDLDRAVIQRQAVSFEQVAQRSVRMRRGTRRALFQHPTTTIAFPPVLVPPGATLQFAVGMLPGSWERPGDGVRFVIELIDDQGAPVEIYSRYIDPKRFDNLRRWLEARVDLRGHAGRRVTLVFKTLPGPEGNSFFDWAVWAEPRLIAGSAP